DLEVAGGPDSPKHEETGLIGRPPHVGCLLAERDEQRVALPLAELGRVFSGHGRARNPIEPRELTVESKSARPEPRDPQAVLKLETIHALAVFPQFKGALVEKRTIRIPKARLGDDHAG